MTKETNKFHALQLFTDTFTAETVHLTNDAIGIYIRLLSFAWTKNTKPFKEKDAFRICQCIDDECELKVMEVLKEFFIISELDGEFSFTHKRLVQEHAYLVDKYHRRSEAGKKGGLAKRENATSKNVAPIPSPIPSPSPKDNIYDQEFENLWNALSKKRGSKHKAHQIFQKVWEYFGMDLEDVAIIYNNQIKGIEDTKFIPHFATWLSQRRWEIEDDNNQMPDLIDRLVNLGYIHIGKNKNFELFSKDGKNYKIDIFDEKHQIQLIQ